MLLVVAALWFVTQPCYQGPRYFEVAYAAVVLTTALWASLTVVGEVRGWRLIAAVGLELGKSVASFCLLLTVAVLACSFFVPTYQCYTDRARTAELILEASQYKPAIEENIRQYQSIKRANDGILFRPQGRVQAGGVLLNGSIVALGDDPTALIVLVPSLKKGVVTWECFGFPMRNLPSVCKNMPSF